LKKDQIWWSVVSGQWSMVNGQWSVKKQNKIPPSVTVNKFCLLRRVLHT